MICANTDTCNSQIPQTPWARHSHPPPALHTSVRISVTTPFSWFTLRATGSPEVLALSAKCIVNEEAGSLRPQRGQSRDDIFSHVVSGCRSSPFPGPPGRQCRFHFLWWTPVCLAPPWPHSDEHRDAAFGFWNLLSTTGPGSPPLHPFP